MWKNRELVRAGHGCGGRRVPRKIRLAMYARAVDDAAARLRELRREEREDLGLGALAFALAVAASEIRPGLAMPLFLGGLAVGALGLRALWHRWDLVDRLAAERDASVIPEVRAYASRQATMERRHDFAASIRSALTQLDLSCHAATPVDELEALASELEDDKLAFEPACAVACTRLLGDTGANPFLNPAMRPEELRSRVRQIRAGFRPRRTREV